MKEQHYDIIGDIHGYAKPLEALLIKLGYTQENGTYQHHNRQAIFLGDFIDRGTAEKTVLDIVRPMIDKGHALAVMGNHEFNAICYATTEGGEYLRPHNTKNTKQHQAFLDEFPFGSKEHTEIIEWFKTLPVYLNLDNIGVVHACLCEDSFKKIKPFLNNDKTILEHAYSKYSDTKADFRDAIEIILKGPEHNLPTDLYFHDADGNERKKSRLNWWVNAQEPLSEKLALAGKKLSQEQKDIVNNVNTCTKSFNTPAKPVFIGHYWMKGTPDALSDTVACVDYSVAKGGKMTAYQWSGEKVIDANNFTWV